MFYYITVWKIELFFFQKKAKFVTLCHHLGKARVKFNSMNKLSNLNSRARGT